MGKKKASNRDEEGGAAAKAATGGGRGKLKKKEYAIDDDEYSIATELSEDTVASEEKVATVGNKKKGKKGASKKVGVKDDDEDVGFNEVAGEVEEGDGDDDAPVMKFAGKKKVKGKKGGGSSVFSASAFGLLGDGGEEKEEEKDGDEREDNNDEDEDSALPMIAFSGKKKASKSKKGGTGVSSAFDMLDEGEESNDKDESFKEGNEDVEISFTGKKKKKLSKGSKKLIDEENDVVASVSKFGNDFVGDGVDDQEEDVSAVKFSGKKKSSKKKNVSVDAAVEEVGNDAVSSDIFKTDQNSDGFRTKKSTNEEVVDTSKDKKKKKKAGKAGNDDDFDKLLAELDGAPAARNEDENDAALSDIVKLDQHTDDSSAKKPTNDMTDTSKNKKKKKKTGKTGQEEDDLDKILAEIDGPAVSEHVPTQAAPPLVDKVQSQPEIEEAAGDKEAEEDGPVESVASKKKKKKKDKEKEKKAAVSEEKQEESKTEINAKASGKKIPKHVREMQERLAKLKEAEEKKKREEEERLRKEEEERRRQEELERLAEERKRLKKEREREKLQKKKQEGKLLTGKQKEEARRLEAMRKQILANAGMPLPTGESAEAPGKPAKRPLYQKKKTKPQAQSNGAATSDRVESPDSKDNQQETVSELDFLEAENVEDVESSSAKDKSEATDVVEENGAGEEEEEEEEEEEDDDDEEWDAKSWDDADLKLSGKSAFADEEVDGEPEPLLKKDIKNVLNATQNVSAASKPSSLTEKVTSVLSHRSDNAESKNKTSEAEGADKSNHKVFAVLDKKNGKVLTKADSPVQNGQNLRSPICCIMGHVDTGKTKLLDCIRGTNVQEGEAGGITQQIGATYFPAENIRQRTKELKADAKLNVPGLLVIDTPGHESFTNLRSRGSGLCDIAILVVDIMHGLEPQTIESLNLLKMRNTEFIVALNKVDRLYGWKTCRNAPIIKAMKQQTKDVQLEFNMRLTQVITQLKEQGLNTELYYKNKEMGETFSIVPTSAISGEGVPDLLLLLVQWTQKTMIKRLTYSDEVQCTVLEVKVVEGHGTTIDVVLVNGVLHEGDQIVVCGLQGPIVTTIRALLTPHPMRELRVKGAYLHHKEIKAAQGIKITAQGLEHAIAGTSLYVVGPDDDLEDIKATIMEDMDSVMNRIDKSGEGVYVQASTLGSLEALLEFLKTPAVNIPVSGISIGPVHKKDVMKASVMLEKKKEYGTILAFDVKVTPEARELADELGVKIFIADIIYHLFDQFKAYIDNLKEEKRKQAADEAVFPCVLKIIPNCVFNKKDPIVLGVDVLEGMLKVGTPICVPQKEFIEIGRIASIENNHKAVDYAKKGQQVAIKIIGSNPDEQQKMFGRHFEVEDELVSRITRNSLDALKEHYADDLSTEEKRLLFKLKRVFKIP